MICCISNATDAKMFVCFRATNFQHVLDFKVDKSHASY